MIVSYQARIPYGTMSNLYLGLKYPDLPSLQAAITSYNASISATYTNNIILDANNNAVSYLIARNNVNQKFQYDNFTPTSQNLQIYQYNNYNASDGLTYTACAVARYPTVDFTTNPQLLPLDCFTTTLVGTYTFPISQT